ncbi:hypothetical protein ROLI_023100 [Roseobacter fucihabitans]|uniref:Uncharacterized protein n=1 Tax=Roseobacter fucihabitans TaxID=1537242 RepID=A0ABZ2BTR3_9RHOB|nr:hypothetical protein [Roseobacter litoralis]
MQRMDWQDCRKAFYVDGSLREIYVRDTTAADWDVFLDAVSSKITAYFCRWRAASSTYTSIRNI